MKKIISFLLAAMLTIPVIAQSQESQAKYDQKMEWWRDAKFGMFIHWGPYSLYGGVYDGYKQRRGGAEWIMNRCKIPVNAYKAMATTFNPTEFNAEDIVLTAKNAGMKYIVLTSKHHDGFAMFKSDATNFNIVDYTPFKRDVVDEMAKACRKYDMKFGLYYSQSQDWTHPGGITSRKEMKEGWPNPDSLEVDAYTKAHKGSWDAIQTSKTMDEYFHEIAIPQIKEILSKYGDIAILWFDTPGSISKEIAQEISDIVAQYPNMITNDRLKRPDFAGDYKTPEGRIPKEEDIEGVDWETCMNIGSSWGYKSWENQWKDSKTIVRNLITIASMGGNYLLNVGPDSKGVIPQPALNCLKEVGEWMKVNGEAIYGTRKSDMHPTWGQCTRKDGKKNTIYYLSVFDWPENGKLMLETPYKVKSATLLSDQTKLKFKKTKGGIVIDVPAEAPDQIATVIKVELGRKLPPVKTISNTQKYLLSLKENENK